MTTVTGGPAPPPPPSPSYSDQPPGNRAAEIAIFVTCVSSFIVYHVYYFGRHHFNAGCTRSRWLGWLSIDLWTTALISRVLWAQELMTSKEEALLAVQTLRNVIVAATLLVTGIGQARVLSLDFLSMSSS